MGERYKETLEKKIKEFGGGNLRVFINADTTGEESDDLARQIVWFSPNR